MCFPEVLLVKLSDLPSSISEKLEFKVMLQACKLGYAGL